MLPIHPGLILSGQIEANGQTIAGFARAARINKHLLKRVLTGQRRISKPVALRLGRYFGNGPWYWLALEDRYAHAVRPSRRMDFYRLGPILQTSPSEASALR